MRRNGVSKRGRGAATTALPSGAGDWWLVKLDEREHWTDRIKDKTRAIYGVYAFNRSEKVYIASLTPSYELWWIGYDFESKGDLSEDQEEKLAEDITDGYAQTEPFTYMNVHDVERVIKQPSKAARAKSVGLDADDYDSIDSIGEGQFFKEQDVVDYIMEHWNTGALMY